MLGNSALRATFLALAPVCALLFASLGGCTVPMLTTPDAGTGDPDAPETDAPVELDAPAEDAGEADAPSDAGRDAAGLFGNGDACTAGDECASSFCVDGVCCDTDCAGTCMACVASLTTSPDGQCAPVIPGTMTGECAASAPTSCGTTGACDGAGACAVWASSTVCAAATCDSRSSLTPARHCDGAGACEPPVGVPCGAYACSGGMCLRGCSSDADCAVGLACSFGGTCLAI